MAKRRIRPIDPIVGLFPGAVRWRVEAPYRWIDSRNPETKRKSRYLAPADVDNRSTNWTSPPADLFRVLSGVEPTEDAVREFADTYGRLGLPFLESFQDWERVITLLARVVERVDASDDEFGTLHDQLLAADLTRVLRDCAVTVAVGHGPDGFRATFDITNLVGFCLAQAVRALTGELAFRRCRSCGKTLTLTPKGGFRSHAQTCSPRCRQKLKRTRIKQALTLKAGGKTPKEIADALSVPVGAVRVYLKKE
jgi:hypothetical protein